MDKILTFHGNLVDLVGPNSPIMGKLNLTEENLISGYAWMINQDSLPSKAHFKRSVANGFFETRKEPFVKEHRMHLLLTDLVQNKRAEPRWDNFDYVLNLMSPRSSFFADTSIPGCYEGRWVRLEKGLLTPEAELSTFVDKMYNSPHLGKGSAKLYVNEG